MFQGTGVLVCLWLLAAVPVFADFNSGKEAIARGDVQKAFREWRLSAQEGHPEAQNALGNLYFYGIGVKQDYREALRWYEKVSAQDDTESLQNMGTIYANGLGGVRQDLRKAFELYLKVANMGHPGGQFFVGHFYAGGLGVEKDNVKALMWFDLAASRSRVRFDEFQSAGAEALMIINSLKTKMSADEIHSAFELSKDWKPSGE